MYVCVCARVLMKYTLWAWRPQHSIGFPGSGVTGTVNCPVWVLGTKFRSWARAVCISNHWATSLAPFLTAAPPALPCRGLCFTNEQRRLGEKKWQVLSCRLVSDRTGIHVRVQLQRSQPTPCQLLPMDHLGDSLSLSYRYSNVFPGSCDATRAALWPRKVYVWHGVAFLSSFCPYRGYLKFFLQEMSSPPPVHFYGFISSSILAWPCLSGKSGSLFPRGTIPLSPRFSPTPTYYFSLCLEGVRAEGDNQRDDKLPSLTWEMINLSLGHFRTLAVFPKVLKDADFRGSLDSSLHTDT